MLRYVQRIVEWVHLYFDTPPIRDNNILCRCDYHVIDMNETQINSTHRMQPRP